MIHEGHLLRRFIRRLEVVMGKDVVQSLNKGVSSALKLYQLCSVLRNVLGVLNTDTVSEGRMDEIDEGRTTMGDPS